MTSGLSLSPETALTVANGDRTERFYRELFNLITPGIWSVYLNSGVLFFLGLVASFRETLSSYERSKNRGYCGQPPGRVFQ